MTDEQWLWAYIQQAVDDEIKLEGMCPSCREEVTSKTNRRCSRCGKPIHEVESFTNPNFDMDRYNRLASNGTHHDNCCDDIEEEDIEEE
jgi:predicted amidophosphoribosyltransferase